MLPLEVRVNPLGRLGQMLTEVMVPPLFSRSMLSGSPFTAWTVVLERSHSTFGANSETVTWSTMVCVVDEDEVAMTVKLVGD